jgi:hypothetical protein
VVAVTFLALVAASRATERARIAPRLALVYHEQAARLDPLSAELLRVEAPVARRLGDGALARRSLS